jgi:hypothetical protein
LLLVMGLLCSALYHSIPCSSRDFKMLSVFDKNRWSLVLKIDPFFIETESGWCSKNDFFIDFLNLSIGFAFINGKWLCLYK